jgi:hypothetical protein
MKGQIKYNKLSEFFILQLIVLNLINLKKRVTMYFNFIVEKFKMFKFNILNK